MNAAQYNLLWHALADKYPIPHISAEAWATAFAAMQTHQTYAIILNRLLLQARLHMEKKQ